MKHTLAVPLYSITFEVEFNTSSKGHVKQLRLMVDHKILQECGQKPKHKLRGENRTESASTHKPLPSPVQNSLIVVQVSCAEGVYPERGCDGCRSRAKRSAWRGV